jgi:xanthine dehydrogenase small subunit
MVDQHGSQCGFCTPGFVMSLFAMFHHERESAVKAVDIDLELAGNLCRCTGYAPIVRAAEQALTPGRSDLLSDNITQQLRQLKAIQPINSLETGAGDRLFFTPRTLDELCTTLQKHPRATLVAGATDVGLWVTKQMRRLDSIIYLGGVGELGRIRDDGHGLELGAAVSYTDAIEPISKYYPAFRSLMERIGAKQVRNVGTVGGNIANGSPIGDMPPGLIAAGARLTLCSKAGRRVMDLEDFFIRYGVQDLQQGEFVECLYLPAPEPDQVFATYKISKRIEQDISAVCAAFALKIKGGRIKDARVCFGGMAEIPKRASHCERSLEGRTWNQQSIEMAMTALADDFTPINDMRASRTYRMRVAQNLLQRFYLEQLDLQYPVRLTSKFGQAVSDG